MRIKNASIFPATRARTRKISIVFSATARFTLWAVTAAGAFQYKENGIKDCTNCLFPHRRENYQKVIARYKDILGVLKRLEAENQNRKRGERMTLTQIQYVLAVAETGTISAAAKRLFIAQPSLTASIKELENELQVTLFRPHRTRA